MIEQNGFTPIEKNMLALLSDGLVHSRDEMQGCTFDGGRSAVSFHLCGLRKKLSPGRAITFGTYLISGKMLKGYVLHVLQPPKTELEDQ